MIKKLHVIITRKMDNMYSVPSEYGVTDGIYYDGKDLCYMPAGRCFYYTKDGIADREPGTLVRIPLDDVKLFAVKMADFLEYDTIKEAREAVGLSRAELAHKLGIPKRTIENWDSGKSSPPEWVKRLLIEKITTL